VARERPFVRVVSCDRRALVIDAMIGQEKFRDTYSDTYPSLPFHFLSHAELLCFPRTLRETPPADRSPAVDAIIVPTVREAGQLRSAADLAAQLRCPLIAIYSQRPVDELLSIQREFGQSEVIVVGCQTIFRRICWSCSPSLPARIRPPSPTALATSA